MTAVANTAVAQTAVVDTSAFDAAVKAEMKSINASRTLMGKASAVENKVGRFFARVGVALLYIVTLSIAGWVDLARSASRGEAEKHVNMRELADRLAEGADNSAYITKRNKIIKTGFIALSVVAVVAGGVAGYTYRADVSNYAGIAKDGIVSGFEAVKGFVGLGSENHPVFGPENHPVFGPVNTPLRLLSDEPVVLFGDENGTFHFDRV